MTIPLRGGAFVLSECVLVLWIKYTFVFMTEKLWQLNTVLFLGKCFIGV
jgi:hypothetical protein